MNQNQHNYNNDDLDLDHTNTQTLKSLVTAMVAAINRVVSSRLLSTQSNDDDLSDYYGITDEDGDDHDYYQVTHYDDWQTHDTDYGDYYGITENDSDDHEYYDDYAAKHVVNNIALPWERLTDENGALIDEDYDFLEENEYGFEGVPGEDYPYVDEGFCDEPEFDLPRTKQMPQLEKYIEISIRHYMNKYTGYKQPYIDDIFPAFDKYINGRFFSKHGASWRREVILEQNNGHIDVVFYIYKFLSSDTKYYRFNYIDIEMILSDALLISEEEQKEYYYKP